MPIAHQGQIFLPVLVLVALTFVAFLKMAKERGAAVKSGMNADYYRAHLGEPEPEGARAAARHWDNLFELPTLFYAACITAFVLGAVSVWTLVFAWGFAAARVLQSVVHMTSNAPTVRGIGFSLAFVFAIALWVNVAIRIFAIL